VTERVARGIAAVYPSLHHLWRAYRAAPSDAAARLLLQDLEVCVCVCTTLTHAHEAGPHIIVPHTHVQVDRAATARSTARRLGPALSARIHLALCGDDPNALVHADAATSVAP
jgi:hypothetical protein